MSLTVALLWFKRRMKMGGSYLQRTTRYLRIRLAYTAAVEIRVMSRRAAGQIAAFLSKLQGIKDLDRLGQECYRSILFIQNNFRHKGHHDEARIEILTQNWCKLLHKLFQQSRADRKTKYTLTQIMKVPKSVQYAVLLYFLKKCEQLHQIAFFQWRLYFT